VSCGCLRAELLSVSNVESKTTHGMTATPEYSVWSAMRNRCSYPGDVSFDNYGGRGIRVCSEWDLSFESFYRDMGPRPSLEHSIDRKDNDGPYCKENCRWATRKEQCNNRRSNHLVTYLGETYTISQWSDRLGISKHVIASRLRKGWSVERALTQPVKQKGSK